VAGAAAEHGVIITIDPTSVVPPFEQLRLGIRRLVATGSLPIGSRLPTIRQLAADLGLAPGTVGRAFRELETEGIVESRGRHGTHVRNAPKVLGPVERGKRLEEAAGIYVATIAELSVDRDNALAEVIRALEELGGSDGRR
jgi:GntR family transcriptional regulator